MRITDAVNPICPNIALVALDSDYNASYFITLHPRLNSLKVSVKTLNQDSPWVDVNGWDAVNELTAAL